MMSAFTTYDIPRFSHRWTLRWLSSGLWRPYLNTKIPSLVLHYEVA